MMARIHWSQTHGMSGTPVYKVWRTMLGRCKNPNVKSYKYYGGRGIRVCKRWHKFENFFADIGPRPEGFMIEREDNDGPYSPRNCRWASRSDQVKNKSNTKLLTANGQTKHMAEWARDLGIHPAAILQRLNLGWSVDRSVTEPAPKRPNSKLKDSDVVQIRKLYPSLTMQVIADQFAVSKKTVQNVLHGKIFIDVK